MTTPADILLVQRAHASGGRDAAITEIRRRWPMIAENVIDQTLERVLAAPVEPPPRHAGHGEPHRDGPVVRRRNRKWE